MHLSSIHPIFRNFLNFLQQQNRKKKKEKQFPTYICWAALASLTLCCDKSVFWWPPQEREFSTSLRIWEVIKEMSQQDGCLCEGTTADSSESELFIQHFWSSQTFSSTKAQHEHQGKIWVWNSRDAASPSSSTYSLMDGWEYSSFSGFQCLVWVSISVKVRAKCDPGSSCSFWDLR